MKRKISTLLAILLFFVTVVTPLTVNANEEVSNERVNCKAVTDLKLNQRKLWGDHVLWTRNFIISDIAGLEDKNVVLERLLKNQDDIGASIKQYYGKQSGKKLAELLREHIAIAGQVVDAAKGGKKDDLVKYNKLWIENADKIADFLCVLNPTWCNSDLKKMLHKHLELITDEVVARLNKDWKKNIIAYDKGQEHIFKLADTISEGIIRQFAEKFNEVT